MKDNDISKLLKESLVIDQVPPEVEKKLFKSVGLIGLVFAFLELYLRVPLVIVREISVKR